MCASQARCGAWQRPLACSAEEHTLPTITLPVRTAGSTGRTLRALTAVQRVSPPRASLCRASTPSSAPPQTPDSPELTIQPVFGRDQLEGVAGHARHPALQALPLGPVAPAHRQQAAMVVGTQQPRRPFRWGGGRQQLARVGQPLVVQLLEGGEAARCPGRGGEGAGRVRAPWCGSVAGAGEPQGERHRVSGGCAGNRTSHPPAAVG
jgi:hypothetical protein